MVDFRPLLFINALALMLLVTAGFASISDDVGRAQSPALVEAGEPEQAPATAVPEKEEEIAVAGRAEPEPRKPVAQQVSASTTAAEMTDSEHDTKPSTPQVTPDKREPAPGVARLSPQPAFQLQEPQAWTPDPLPEAAPEPELPSTASLTLRSNVHGDKVVINGTEHGPTRLNLDLKPGKYDVAITKEGYRPWQKTIAVDAGDQLTLVGQLEAYTRVDHRRGTWVGGVKTGDGTFEGKDGLRYEGGFISGQFHGKGTAWYPDGSRYKGDWNNGQRSGEGSFRGADGSTYTGQFANDSFHGQGTLTRANGDILTGAWKNNRLNGYGSLTTQDGKLYVGGFRNDQFHGEGSLTFPDGRSFEGGFSEGEFHGTGSEILAGGKKYQGEYVEGKFHGRGLLLNPNGSSIEATFRYGEPYGQVKLTTPEGEIFRARTSEPGVCYRDKSYRATQCPPLEGW
ncbi:PEGA domain-containing protein [Marinobacter sp.]|uniref:PEGA domain-containing protein n=1 Tax=Marinobacter sp. TaxID=50741 RepID=UPI00384FE3B2